MMLYSKKVPSPVGALQLVAGEKGLCAVIFSSGKAKNLSYGGEIETCDDHPMLLKTETQLAEYFAGARTRFDVKLDMRGTVFQIKAWRELQNIPYGQTISYGEQARRIGDPNKARAVGMANGRNPLAIIVPCHRVIGSTGALVGFGGGLGTKQKLLALESATAA